MAKTLTLFYEKDENITRTGYVGFSWTCFFFNFFPPLIRRDYKNAVFLFFLAFALSILTRIIVQSLGVPGMLLGFVMQLGYMIILGLKYNNYYTQNLINQGWLPKSEEDKNLLREYNINF